MIVYGWLKSVLTKFSVAQLLLFKAYPSDTGRGAVVFEFSRITGLKFKIF